MSQSYTHLSALTLSPPLVRPCPALHGIRLPKISWWRIPYPSSSMLSASSLPDCHWDPAVLGAVEKYTHIPCASRSQHLPSYTSVHGKPQTPRAFMHLNTPDGQLTPQRQIPPQALSAIPFGALPLCTQSGSSHGSPTSAQRQIWCLPNSVSRRASAAHSPPGCPLHGLELKMEHTYGGELLFHQLDTRARATSSRTSP